MNENELNFILQEGEGLKIEFKENTKNIDKELVAFANAEGGRIFIGITDDNKIRGIGITNKLKSELQKVVFYGPGEKITELIPEKKGQNLRELGLNERQIKALKLMVNEGKKFSNKEYRMLLNVSNQTFVRDMRLLRRLNLVATEGSGRSLRYKAKMS